MSWPGPRTPWSAFSRSGGQPHIPSPLRRIAPKPSRLTKRSPPNKNVSSLLLVLALAAATILRNPPVRAHCTRETCLVRPSSHVSYVAYINYHPPRRTWIPKEGPDRDDWKPASRDLRAFIDICGPSCKER